jgi:PPOX class probable F420-dependent enzyme
VRPRPAGRTKGVAPYTAGMDLQRALEFAAGRRNTLLTTLRADGRPQQSVVFYLADGDRFTISITDDRAKTRNLRRDPRAALYIAGDDAFTWVGLDGHVELSPVAQSPDDAVVDRLVEYYRRGNGEHGDWDEYRRAMVDQRRLVATFVATSATGILPD